MKKIYSKLIPIEKNEIGTEVLVGWLNGSMAQIEEILFIGDFGNEIYIKYKIKEQ